MRTLPPCHVAALDKAAITGLSNMKMGVYKAYKSRPRSFCHDLF